MTAQILPDHFAHLHNPLEVARQEHELAKAHFREVVMHREAGNASHERRFRDALERRNAARDRYVEMLTS